MCATCPWSDLLHAIEEAADDDRFVWAKDTLDGIYETVERMEHCTERQVEAIQNILRARGEDVELEWKEEVDPF